MLPGSDLLGSETAFAGLASHDWTQFGISDGLAVRAGGRRWKWPAVGDQGEVTPSARWRALTCETLVLVLTFWADCVIEL